jgi:tetratricopeptide (TPR) repeat protein
MIQAKELFEKAISEDPTYAPAYAGLSDAYYLLGDYWAMPVEEARRKSKGLLSQALKLDSDLPEAHARLAMNLAEEYSFAEAVPEFRRAIGLNPSYAMSHMWYASCLGALRRYEEQLGELEIAEQLDPLSTVVLGNEIMVLALLGRKESAWQKVGRMSELDPGSVSSVDVTSFYHYLAGDPARALSEVEKHPELHNEFPIMWDLAMYLAATGAKEAALSWLDRLLAVPETTFAKAWAIALVYAELRDYDRFFVWANKAVDKKEMRFDNLELFPCLRGIAENPRWKALLSRANLDSI